MKQYYISVVPTTYIARSGYMLLTNQYSVTDMSRSTDHGKGIPGIFFKYGTSCSTSYESFILYTFIHITTSKGPLLEVMTFFYFILLHTDIEPMHLTIHEKATSLIQFLVRLTAMIGGIVVCSSWGFSLFNRIAKKTFPSLVRDDDVDDDDDDGGDLSNVSNQHLVGLNGSNGYGYGTPVNESNHIIYPQAINSSTDGSNQVFKRIHP
ncbi:hypothetical protein BY996DRAFT_1211979 [Phakopsora pachyrhizi]|nr:hypothetical protein BY996DRAFT_1211979 [Phakopsora pachyrhizi]